MDPESVRALLSRAASTEAVGRVLSATGLCVRAELPGARLGNMVIIHAPARAVPAEIVGFDCGQCVLMPLGDVQAIGPDDRVTSQGTPLQLPLSQALLGSVLDGLGRPLSAPPQSGPEELRSVDTSPPPALERPTVRTVLPTGVRVIDGLLTIGEGQRIGLFAGSGVGKSTLLGTFARNSTADVVVIALVGERSREVVEFVEECLGPEGLKRAVVVAATSDAHAVERVRAAQTATTVAEFFRDQGKRVLLLVDSLTRFARAQREVGLASGEPPGRRGYPPSVFAMLPRLVERAGQSRLGSITAMYTVLVEGGDLDEPIADEVRGLLDGHIVLSRSLAERGHFPAVDVSASISRAMHRVVSPDHLQAASSLRSLIAHYEQKRDLVMMGAYKEGLDLELDRAIAAQSSINRFLRQSAQETAVFAETEQHLAALAGSY